MQILQLPTLLQRRRRGDLIEAFKIIRGYYNLNCQDYFTPVDHDYFTRGHELQLARNDYSKTKDLNWFVRRVVGDWNNLPNSAVNAQSVNSFKNQIDIHYFTN